MKEGVWVHDGTFVFTLAETKDKKVHPGLVNRFSFRIYPQLIAGTTEEDAVALAQELCEILNARGR